MIFKDYYKILELDTTRVSLEDIKNAYRRVAKKHHPDLNIGNELAEERIKDINEAYRVLSNSTAKRKYDRMWNANVLRKRRYQESNRKTGSVFSEFFYMFFGNIEEKEPTPKHKKQFPVKGENVETEINVDLEEAFYGMNKKISLKTVTGKIKTFTVAVPEGIQNGEKIRLIGQGKQGEHGGKNGDLFIKINIQDKGKFKLKGNDLYTDLRLAPWEAALGTRTKLNSIDEETKIYVPQGIQSGELLRIPGKGYKDGNGGRGDLVAQVKVMVPKKLTEQEKQLYESLSKVSDFNPRKAQ